VKHWRDSSRIQDELYINTPGFGLHPGCPRQSDVWDVGAVHDDFAGHPGQGARQFRSTGAQLVSTNLSQEQELRLREVFGED
jgi:hypothetical protein